MQSMFKPFAVATALAMLSLGSSVSFAEDTVEVVDQARDYVAIRNHAWLLAREADGLGDAATLLGFSVLHAKADATRDAANNFRLLVKRIVQGQTPNEAQLGKALDAIKAHFAVLKDEWDQGPYSQNSLLNNNYQETQRELNTVLLLWGE